ncbi:MAG TPA: glycosyltransferase family 39 protein [Solirubrobacterales bacterium]|jgi:4-amino-4-deoxy-L-arabinose transferase-like glycosyltransferase|nr:glycosyltransferase family 39 protein [Solirubrobacterales bacterium]
MTSGLVQRNGGRLGLAVLAAILLLGLGLRVDEAWDGRAPAYDARAYAAIAANLERSEGFTMGSGATQPSSNYSPGLPLFVAGVYEASGGVHERLARLLLAAIGTLAVLFAYLIGRRLSGVAAGLIGATAVAIYPALLEYQGMLMSEPLAATLLAGAVLAIFWAKEQSRRAAWLPPGVLLGALALVRPEYLGVAFLLGLVVFAAGAREDWRHLLASVAILLAGVVLVVAPWTIRNASALNRFVPISTGGGQVLFAGTYLPSDGDPEKVGAEVVARHPGIFAPGEVQRLRLEQILATLAAHRYPQLETDQALSRMGRENLWDGISEEPLPYAGFTATKVARIWAHGPRDVMREVPWEILHWALIAFGLLGLVVLALPRGAFVSLSDQKAPHALWEATVLATIFLAITALSALLVASPRRVLVMLPLVAALAGVGAVWAWQMLRRDSLAP